MGYAGRMLAKHNPWLIFGLWVVLVGLLNVSIYVLKQGLAFLFIIESTTNLVGPITYSLFPLFVQIYIATKIMELF